MSIHWYRQQELQHLKIYALQQQLQIQLISQFLFQWFTHQQLLIFPAQVLRSFQLPQVFLLPFDHFTHLVEFLKFLLEFLGFRHQLQFHLLQLYPRLEEFHLLAILWLLLVKVQRWSLGQFLLWQIKLLLAFLPELRVPLIHLSLKALFHLSLKALFTRELLPKLHFILHYFSPNYLHKSWQLPTLQPLL